MAAAVNGGMVAWREFGQDFYYTLLQLIPDVFLHWACDIPTQGGGVLSAAQLGKMMEQILTLSKYCDLI